MKNECLWTVDIEFKILMRTVKSLLKQTTTPPPSPSKFAVPHSLIHWRYSLYLISKLPFSLSGSLRPGCEKWIIGYNFCIDDDAESKFGTQKELIVGNILEYKHVLNKSRGMSRDHLAKNCELLCNRWPV